MELTDKFALSLIEPEWEIPKGWEEIENFITDTEDDDRKY